jgi:hypothetical protein
MYMYVSFENRFSKYFAIISGEKKSLVLTPPSLTDRFFLENVSHSKHS